MLETLQGNARTDEQPATPARPTALILNDEYVGAAQALLKTAVSEVRICAYAWRWYENEPEVGIQQINMALYALRGRGVVVRAIVDTLYIKQQMEALGFAVRCIETNRTLHTKAIGVDTSGLLIGSHNLTKRATCDNIEASVLIHEPAPVIAYNEYFERLWAAYG